MTVIGEAYIEVKPDSANFGPEAERGVLGSVGSIAKKAGAILGGAFVVKEAFDFGRAIFQSAEEATKGMAQTEAAIESTGGAANVTAGDIDNLTDSLAKHNTVEDDAIRKGANLLLTFTNVKNGVGEGNDIFNQATQGMIDMAAAMGTDVAGGAIQLGKALNDPVAGIAALTRVGVQFTDQQKAQIEAMVEAGDVAGAQKVILAELETQFGGSAAAQATAAEKARLAWGEFQEELGLRLMPVVERVASFLAEALPGALDWVNGAVQRGVVLWGTLGPILATLADVVGVTLVTAWNVLVGILGNPVFQVVAAVIGVALVPALIALGVHAALAGAQTVFWWLAMQGAAIASAATSIAQLVLMGAKFIWMGITALASAAQVAAAWLIALGPIALLVAAVVGAAILIVNNWDWIKETVGNVVGAIGGFLSDLIGWVVNFVQEWGVLLLGPIGMIWKFRDEIWGAIQAVIGFFGRLASGAADKLGELISDVMAIPGRILAALGNLGGILYDAGLAIMRGLRDGIVAGFNAVKDFVGGIAGKIISLKGPLDYDKRMLIPAGRAIMDSLNRGMAEREAALKARLAALTQRIASVGPDSPTGQAAAGTSSTSSAAAVPAALLAEIRTLVAAVAALAQGGGGSGTWNLSGTDPVAVGAVIERNMNWGAAG